MRGKSVEKVAKNKLTAKEIEYFAAIRNELSKDKGSNLIEIAERFGIKPKRDIIADRKKSWERTQTFKMFGDKRSKGITVNPPFELTWKGPGCREKYVNIKIIQPINNQIWKDLWVAVEDRQEDAFGKIPKGRPKCRPYR